MKFHERPSIRPRDVCAQLGGVALLLAVACSREPSLPGVLHLVPEGVAEESLIVGRVSRMGFASDAARTHRVHFRVPKGHAMLWLACGAPRDSGETLHKAACRAVLRDGPGNSRTVFQRSADAEEWAEEAVNLRPYAGQTVELLLGCDADDPPQGAVTYWATPIVAVHAPDRPNVLLICIDSLRADHLGCYGYPRNTSPTLDSLASRGCLFERAIAQSSWTLPSHASLFTSLYQRTHGVGSIHQALGPSADTLAEELRKSGYLTVAVVSGGPLAPAYGLSQGFDVYDAHCWAHSHGNSVTSPCTHERASGWLRLAAHCPFFMFVHFWDVHYDYVPPAPYDTLFDPSYTGAFDGIGVIPERLKRSDLSPQDIRHLVALYDGEVAHTDSYVGILLNELDRAGLSDRTVVVVTSDHGDEFFEHGTTGHGHTLFQELIRVPLIWSDPSGTTRRGRTRDLVELVDIAPTLLELVGSDIPQTMQGTSVLPLLTGMHQDPSLAFSEVLTQDGRLHELTAVLIDDAKAVASPAVRLADLAVYDLVADPDESRSRRVNAIAQGAQLRAALEEFAATTGEAQATVEVRVIGTKDTRSYRLVFKGRGFTSAAGRMLEPEDTLVVNADTTTVALLARCGDGDADGVSLGLATHTAAFSVDAVCGTRGAPPGGIHLGAGAQSPPAVPFKVRGDDNALQGRSVALTGAAPAPGIYLWALDTRSTSAVSVHVSDEFRQQLRALGYLW